MDWKLISPHVLKQCQSIHEDKKVKWGNDGHKRGDIVLDFVHELRAESVLDYGCGRGTLKKRLGAGGKKIPGLGWMGTVYEYDPAIRKKNVPHSADVVACTDVMEHVEPDKVRNVLRHAWGLARKGAFFLICTRDANMLLPDGQNAHLTVRNADWWKAEFAACGIPITREHLERTQCLFWCAR